MMNIRSLTAPNPGPFTLDGTRTYMIGETVVLDPGPLIPSHIHAVRRAQPGLELILLTHRHGDHAPGAVPLKEATNARIVAPRGVLDDRVVDRRVSGGEEIVVENVTIEVIATPGHTGEHVCYLTSEGDLFSGDMILGSGTTAIMPPDGNMSDYMRSLAALRARNPKRIHPAHGPTREDAVALIDEYIAHRLDREKQVVDALASGAKTVSVIRERIYPDLDGALTRAAEGQIFAHLQKLAEEGRGREEGGVWSLSGSA